MLPLRLTLLMQLLLHSSAIVEKPSVISVSARAMGAVGADVACHERSSLAAAAPLARVAAPAIPLVRARPPAQAAIPLSLRRHLRSSETPKPWSVCCCVPNLEC